MSALFPSRLRSTVLSLITRPPPPPNFDQISSCFVFFVLCIFLRASVYRAHVDVDSKDLPPNFGSSRRDPHVERKASRSEGSLEAKEGRRLGSKALAVPTQGKGRCFLQRMGIRS